MARENESAEMPKSIALRATLACGERGWVFNGARVKQLTVGQIRLVMTRAKGVANDWEREGGVLNYSGGSQEPDNYSPQSSYVEEYMCEETGIGSGSIYTLGKSIFATEAECREACAEAIAAEEQRKKDVAKYERERLLNRETEARQLLARIEAVKALGESA